MSWLDGITHSMDNEFEQTLRDSEGQGSLACCSAAAAKSFQLCLTLCDPMDCSLPGSSAHGTFQARVLEWGAIVFSVRTPSDQISRSFVSNSATS